MIVQYTRELTCFLYSGTRRWMMIITVTLASRRFSWSLFLVGVLAYMELLASPEAGLSSPKQAPPPCFFSEATYRLVFLFWCVLD